MIDTCPHGIPYRFPETCDECEAEEVEAPLDVTVGGRDDE